MIARLLTGRTSQRARTGWHLIRETNCFTSRLSMRSPPLPFPPSRHACSLSRERVWAVSIEIDVNRLRAAPLRPSAPHMVPRVRKRKDAIWARPQSHDRRCRSRRRRRRRSPLYCIQTTLPLYNRLISSSGWEAQRKPRRERRKHDDRSEDRANENRERGGEERVDRRTEGETPAAGRVAAGVEMY